VHVRWSPMRVTCGAEIGAKAHEYWVKRGWEISGRGRLGGFSGKLPSGELRGASGAGWGVAEGSGFGPFFFLRIRESSPQALKRAFSLGRLSARVNSCPSRFR
jgi:hypothetical protein